MNLKSFWAKAARALGPARWLALLLVATLLPACKPAGQQEAAAAGPDAAWERLESAAKLSEFPAEWRTNRPSPEAVEAFRNEQRDRAAAASEQARDFYTRHPNDPAPPMPAGSNSTCWGLPCNWAKPKPARNWSGSNRSA